MQTGHDAYMPGLESEAHADMEKQAAGRGHQRQEDREVKTGMSPVPRMCQVLL